MTLDQLNVSLKNISDNRAQVAMNIAQLREQLTTIPAKIKEGIEKQTKLAGEMDAAIAALQVVMTDTELLKQTEAQIAVNASSPPAAAGGSPAARQQSATGAETAGDSGSAGLAHQPTAPGSHSPSAANAASFDEATAD